MVDEADHSASGRDRRLAEQQRQRSGDRRAEDEQQDDQKQRRRDQLGALHGVERLAVDAGGDVRVAGDVSAHRRARRCRDELADPRRRLLAGGLERLVDAHQDDRPSRARMQLAACARRPRADRVDAREPIQSRSDIARGGGEPARRPLEHDHEVLAVAEVLLGELGGRGGRRTRHDEVLPVQAALDADPERGKGEHHGGPGAEQELRACDCSAEHLPLPNGSCSAARRASMCDRAQKPSSRYDVPG